MCLLELAVRVFITMKIFPFIFKITSLAYLRYPIVTAWSVRKRMQGIKSCRGPSRVPCCWPYWVKKIESLWLTWTLHHLSPVRSVHTEWLGWLEGSVGTAWWENAHTQTWLEFMSACTQRVRSCYLGEPAVNAQGQRGSTASMWIKPRINSYCSWNVRNLTIIGTDLTAMEK